MAVNGPSPTASSLAVTQCLRQRLARGRVLYSAVMSLTVTIYERIKGRMRMLPVV